jgi:dATP pyrophosphohydrolase
LAERSTQPERIRPWKIPLSVLVVIHTSDLRVLLIKRSDMLTWQSVTGSKDHLEETWAQTAQREVLEETGINVLALGLNLVDRGRESIYPIHPAYRRRYAPEVTHNTERLFTLEIPPETPIELNPTEHIDFVWVMQDRASQMVFSATNAQAIRDLGSF